MLPHYSPTGSDSASASQRCPPDTRTLVRGRQRKRAIRESPLLCDILFEILCYVQNDKQAWKTPQSPYGDSSPFRGAKCHYAIAFCTYIISPPPRTVSPSNITSDCPFVIARCGSSNFT